MLKIFIYMIWVQSFASANTADCIDRIINKLMSEDVALVTLSSDSLNQETRDLIKKGSPYFSYGSTIDKTYFDKIYSDDADFMRFIRKGTYLGKKATESGFEMYGKEHFIAWKDADQYLKSIPQGNFNLDLDIINETNRRATAGFKTKLDEFTNLIPDGYVMNKGGQIKKRFSFGGDPIINPLTEKQYQALKENKWLTGFKELPYPMSKPGARRGIIVYGDPQHAEDNLKRLIKWYNENKKSIDPVELAAQFQKSYISIHPHMDGNGRTSRLIADRILAEHGLPPPLLTETNNDIYTSLEDWIQQYRRGVEEHYAVLNTTNQNVTDPDYITHAPSVLKADLKKNPPLVGKQLILGNREFTFLYDGFFYTNEGIPYLYKNGTLFPVADRTYQTILQTRKVDPVTGKIDLGNQGDIFRDHYRLLREIRDGKFKASELEVIDYSTIEKANNLGELHIYPWQKKMFENAITIKETKPIDILAGKAQRATEIEEEVFNTSKSAGKLPRPLPGEVTPSEIIGQYQKKDLELSESLRYAKKNFPDLVPQIEESRQKVHQAARTLLNPYFEAKKRLSPQAKMYIENMPKIKALDDYINASNLGYEDFQTALKKNGDNSIALLRVDTQEPRLIGFADQSYYKAIFEMLPGSKKLENAIKEYKHQLLSNPEASEKLKEKIDKISDFTKKYEFINNNLPQFVKDSLNNSELTSVKIEMLISMISNQLLSNKIEVNGAVRELQRQYVNYFLHSKGSFNAKQGVSFTSKPFLVFNDHGDATFINSDLAPKIFLVNVPKNKVNFNYASIFNHEYEFILNNHIGPQTIKKSYTPKLAPKIDDEKLAAEVDTFLKSLNVSRKERP